jgi:hypothetical protein
MLTWMLSVAWILGLAGSAIVLALVLHFLVPAKGAKVPAVIIGTIGGLVVGICLGIGGAIYYGDQMSKSVYANEYAPGPMPKGGTPKGSNTAAVSPPGPDTKKAEEDSINLGPGVPRLPSSYPGFDEVKKRREEEKNAAKAKSKDAPEK